mgnify:CR=1 FL=1|jgi:hypothetical protein
MRYTHLPGESVHFTSPDVSIPHPANSISQMQAAHLLLPLHATAAFKQASLKIVKGVASIPSAPPPSYISSGLCNRARKGHPDQRGFPVQALYPRVLPSNGDLGSAFSQTSDMPNTTPHLYLPYSTTRYSIACICKNMYHLMMGTISEKYFKMSRLYEWLRMY